MSFSSQQSHQQLIRTLYEQQKAANSKFSLSYLCRHSGIPSKGYLGDVMKNRRRLNLKYAARLGKALGLNGARLRSFCLMVRRDHEQDPAKRAQIEKKLSIQRVHLKPHVDLRSIAKVFSCTGLVKGPFTAHKLVGKLSDMSEAKIHICLKQLVEIGALIESDGGYVLRESQFVFPSAESPQVVNEFFQASIVEAALAIPKWFRYGDESFIQSTVLSVKKSVYMQRLPEIKEFFDSFQSDIEASDGDALVYFNIQVYPEK